MIYEKSLLRRIENYFYYTLNARVIERRLASGIVRPESVYSQKNLARAYRFYAKVQWHPAARKMFKDQQRKKVDGWLQLQEEFITRTKK